MARASPRIVMENGATFAATIFADATYEGDLMAQAGVSYTWGREGSAEYGESLAGVRDHTPKHQFPVEVSPRDRNGRLLPEDLGRDRGSARHRRPEGAGVQLPRLHDDRSPTNRVPFPKPAGYTPARYALLARMLEAMDRVKREASASAEAQARRRRAIRWSG